MSIVSARSTTGCLTCKTKRKKCDETKPHCLRCQKSNIECPGYTYIYPQKSTRKLRTLLAPRTLVGQSRTTARQGTFVTNPEDVNLQEYYDLSSSNISNNGPSTFVENTRVFSEAIDTSNPWIFLSSFSGSLEHPLIDFNISHGITLGTTNPGPIDTPGTSDPTPMSSGQASLLESLFSLGQPPVPFSQYPRPEIDLTPDPSTLPTLNWSPPNPEAQGDVKTPDDEDPEEVVSVICSTPVLDKTAEGNALPFLLQSYATWIRRMAFEPLKVVQSARDFVFSHFADGKESRWILTLLANIGSKIGSAEILSGNHDPMLSTLQKAVRRRLDTVKSRPTSNRQESIKALDSALETIIINFFVSPLSDVVTLREEAAPIFRQLCPEPPDEPINLQLLLRHPPACLRHYAHVDILFSVIMDMPTLFRYGTTIPSSQLFYPYELVIETQGDSGLQWLHGIPDPLILLFAKIKLMRDDGSRPSTEVVRSFEREIRELQPYSSPSSESFLMITRFVVQECWRQVAYVYLYMALCGDSSGAPRVKGAFKHFTRLLSGIKPGRLPDEFLIMNLILIAPAAEQKRDREVIRQRILGIYAHGRTFRANENTLRLIEDYWARAGAEGRQVLWSDVAVSRKRVLGL